MIFLLFCIEEDNFLPEFNPPGIKVEDVYFKMERYLEFEIGIGNKFDIVNFSRLNTNYLYGIYIRENYITGRLKYDLERIYGELRVIGKPANPFIYYKNRSILFTNIPLLLETGFSGYKDSFNIFSTVDLIVPYEELYFGFTGGYRKSIFTGMFLQSENKRLTLGKDIFEILIFSDIYFLSIRYSYDLLPFYDYWTKTDHRFLPITSLELLYGLYYLKTGFVNRKPFFYLNIKNSEVSFYDRNTGVSIFYSMKNRLFKTRFLFNCSFDYKIISGLFGIFIIPESRYLPFIGGVYNHRNYWRIFAGIKFE